jgi:hypothetical protein
MDDSKVKKWAEEIKKEIDILFPKNDNKRDLYNKLCEKDDEKDSLFADLIEKAFKEEEANQQENTQNSTKDTTNKMSSEGSNRNESGFNSSSNQLPSNSFNCNEEKNRNNDDNSKLIKDIADRILEILEDEYGKEKEESLKNFLMEVFRYFNCKP